MALDGTSIALITQGGALAILALGNKKLWYYGSVVIELLAAKDAVINLKDKRITDLESQLQREEERGDRWRVEALEGKNLVKDAISVAVQKDGNDGNLRPISQPGPS